MCKIGYMMRRFLLMSKQCRLVDNKATMTNNSLQPEDEFLQVYCHYPKKWAEEENDNSQNDLYRVTTINWTFATDHISGSKVVDYNYVHKNIYEMTLGEFKEWCLGVCNKQVAEEIIKIEKVSE